MPAFSAFKGVAGRGEQRMTVGAQANYVLLNDTTFTNFDRTKKIVVTITGDITSTSISTDAFVVGDLSTWNNVDIINDANIYGKGGDGGVGEAAGGGGDLSGQAGGDSVFINTANSSAIISFTNNSGASMRGGGGGGGGGARTSAASGIAGKFCDTGPTVFAPSGGGGGGAGQNIGGGGAGGTGGTTPGGAGVSGTATLGGAGGAFGTRNHFDAACISVTLDGNLGGAAGDSGLVGSGGPGGGGAGGAAGFYIRNGGSCAFTNNGTVTGNND